MGMMQFLIILIALMLAAYLSDRYMAAIHRKALSTRSEEPLEEIYETLGDIKNRLCFTGFKVAFSKLEEFFGVDVHRIRLSDQFGRELGARSRLFPFYDSIECEDFYEFIGERAEEFGIDSYSICTVRDYIDFEAQVEESVAKL
jgi:hypothetical protein